MRMSEKNKAMSETFCPIFTKFIYDNAIIEQKIAPFLNLTHLPHFKLASLVSHQQLSQSVLIVNK